MKKLLTRNLGLKLASLLLAFVLWFLVAQIYDPKDTVTFNNIQVRLINTELLDEEGKVYEVLDNSNLVRVTVTGPQSIVKSELRRSEIVAEADMSKLTDINTIAITYYCENISNDSVEIKGNHDSVRLNVEDKTSKWIKLESNTIGDVAFRLHDRECDTGSDKYRSDWTEIRYFASGSCRGGYQCDGFHHQPVGKCGHQAV